ncbi:MAG: HAD family phosphatase [Erysipelotrichaceae bacterium]|nr:HAD family phosphatase [Erysipelotrichaceae bacterium]
MIKNIVFDVNGVLVSNISIETIIAFSQDYTIAKAAMLRKMGRTEIWKRYDTGFYRTRESMADDFAALWPQEEKLIRQVLTSRRGIAVNEKLEKFIVDLKRKYKVYLLSNVGYEDLEKVLPQKFARICDGAVYSCEEGVVKPDERIYRILLYRFGLKAEETVFIDDGRRNIRAARKLGFHAVKHVSNRRTMSEICRIASLE